MGRPADDVTGVPLTDLYDRTDAPEHPEAVGAARFEPVAGERLEHLATEGRGPLRWSAALVLRAQARVDRSSPTSVMAAPTSPHVAGAAAPPMVQSDPDPHPRDPARPGPTPNSGWSWSPDDDRTWDAWEATDATGGTDRRLATLGADLERPLPTAVRWARQLKAPRHRSVNARPEARDGESDRA